jgi:hypothetical protein
MIENKLIKLSILIATVFFFFSCRNLVNPKERNNLVFTDSLSNVSDSVNVMTNFLLNSKNGLYTYGIDVDMNDIDRDENEFFLYIHDNSHKVKNVGIISDNLLYKSNLISFIDTTERKRFVKLALFLNKNYLSGCNIENGNLIFTYRSNIYMADWQEDLDRFVMYANTEPEIDLSQYKILENKNNLYLLAFKTAKIWVRD